MDAEHVGRMDVADHVVDVFMIDQNLTVAALDEHLHQLFDGRRIFYGIDLGARHHTVAHLRIGEIEGILENLDLLADIVFIVGIVDAGLHQIVEVDLRELPFLSAFLHPDAYQAQQALRQECGETRDGIKHDIADPCRNGKESQ